MKYKRMFIILSTILALSFLLSACATSEPGVIVETVEVQVIETVEVEVPAEPEETGPSGRIVLYTSVPLDIINEIRADFLESNPDIDLEIFRGSTGDVMARVDAELTAGEMIADLLWVAEPSTYEILKEQDMLLQFTPAEIDALPETMYDPEGYYYAGRLINMVIAYNTELVTTPPTSWSALSDPAFEGRVGFPKTSSGSSLATVGMLANNPDFGWEFLEAVKANGAVQVKNNGTTRDQLSTGELMVGYVLDYFIRKAKADGAPVDYVWPEEGTALIPSPIAIFSNSSNADVAKVFVDYVLSIEGQQTLVAQGSFIPVRADVDPPEGAPSLDEIEALPGDWAWIAANQQNITDQFNAIFGE